MQKDFQILTLKAVIDNFFFTTLPQISHIHKNRNFLSISGTF